PAVERRIAPRPSPSSANVGTVRLRATSSGSLVANGVSYRPENLSPMTHRHTRCVPNTTTGPVTSPISPTTVALATNTGHRLGTMAMLVLISPVAYSDVMNKTPRTPRLSWGTISTTS